MRRLILLTISLGLVVASCASTATEARLDLVTPRDAAAIIDDRPVVVLDVRTPEEFAEGHLENAINIDFYAADFADQLAGLDPDTEYVVYCRSGNRSGQTIPIMADLGFQSVHDVEGGVLEWVQAGLPLTR